MWITRSAMWQSSENKEAQVLKKEYMLHPDIFKKCLMKSKNEDKYMDYFLLLEKCIKYYNEYQLQMERSEVSRLIKKLDKSEEFNQQILIELKKSNEDNIITHKKLDNITEHCENLQDNIDVIQDKLEERVPNAKTDKDKEIFIVLTHNDEKKYYILTKKESTVKTALQRLKKNSGYDNIILEFKCCPNSSLLYHNMKDKMSNYCKFINTGNSREFALLTSEQEYIDKLTEIYNSRREYKE